MSREFSSAIRISPAIWTMKGDGLCSFGLSFISLLCVFSFFLFCVFFSFRFTFPFFSMLCFSWNCQGVASSNFMRILKGQIKKHHPSVFGLLEPKVSGLKQTLFARKWATITD